jgi:hypothetical protein
MDRAEVIADLRALSPDALVPLLTLNGLGLICIDSSRWTRAQWALTFATGYVAATAIDRDEWLAALGADIPQKIAEAMPVKRHRRRARRRAIGQWLAANAVRIVSAFIARER